MHFFLLPLLPLPAEEEECGACEVTRDTVQSSTLPPMSQVHTTSVEPPEVLPCENNAQQSSSIPPTSHFIRSQPAHGQEVASKISPQQHVSLLGGQLPHRHLQPVDNKEHNKHISC